MKRTLPALLLISCASSPAAPPSSQPSSQHAAGHEHGHGHDHDHGHGHGEKGFHHSFSDAEKWAKRFDDPARDAWQKPEEVVRLSEIEPGMVVADLGAGTGYFLPHLSRAVGENGRVLALDVEPNLVDHMKKRVEKDGLANVEVQLIPTDDPKLEPGSVDVVLIVDTWHHIDARSAYAGKLAAALKPGGRVVVVDFTMDSPEGPPKKHRLPPDAVEKELAGGSLKPETLASSLPRQYVVVGRR